MNIDYYIILQISPDADIETIRRAYRKLAFKYHPDKGGTHEKMVQLNEAWEILSNQITRANYDASRLHAENTEYVRKSETESKEARFKAEQYPRDWEEFETWMDKMLNAVVNDFKKAEYGEMLDGKIPTAGQSFTGWIFIIIGAVLGFFTTVLILSGIKYRGPIFPAFYLLIFAGAWLGKVCHEMMKDQIISQKSFSHSKPAGKVFTNTNEQTSSDQNINSDSQKSSWEQISFVDKTFIIFISMLFIIIILSVVYNEIEMRQKDLKRHQAVAQPLTSPMSPQDSAAPTPVASAVQVAPAAPAAQSISNVSHTPHMKFKYNGYSFSASDHTRSAIINDKIYHEGDVLGDYDEYILKSIDRDYVIIKNKADKSDYVVKFNQ